MMLLHDVVEQVSLARTRGSEGMVAHGRRESNRPALNKHLAVVLCLVMSSLPVPAETQERIEIEAALHTWDGKDVPRELHAFRSAAEVEQAVACVLNEAGGLRSDNFDLQAADVPNAAAAVWPVGCGSGTQPCDRMLLYNPRFMRDIRDRTGNGWSGIAILAHEIGHHLEAHTISARGSNPTDELEADEFAGWVLRRLGATLDEAQAPFRTSLPAGNSTHPPRDARLTAVAAGWDRSGRTGDTSCYAPPEPDLPADPEPPEPPKNPSDRLTIAADLRAEVTNAFYFRTEPSAISPGVQSLGEVDVRAWIHAGLCGDADWNPSNEDFFEDAAGRAEGIPRISFGRIRNTALENVRHSDDDGPDANFRFDLNPGECYRMLVDRHDPTVGGRYAVEWTGTREVAHGSWSPDAGWGDGFHWHDLPASLSTGGDANSMWAYSEPVALRSNVTIAADHLRAEVVTVFTFDMEASAVGASVRSLGGTDVQAWIHAGNCGPKIVSTSDADLFEYARDRSDGNHRMSLGHIRNTALDHVRHSDDDGPGTNFRFDLDPGECYTMLVEGYTPKTSGNYGVEVTGTRRVRHISLSRDGVWDPAWHRHDASAAPDPDPEPSETIVIGADHLRAEVTNIFLFRTEASATSARSLRRRRFAARNGS